MEIDRTINKNKDCIFEGNYVGGDDNSVNINVILNGTDDLGIKQSNSSFICNIRDNKKYYIDKWNDRLFLHRGENDKPLTLSNTFIHHDYSIINQATSKADSEPGKDIENEIEQFIAQRGTGSFLIMGAPGIGKTSLVAYLADKYKHDDAVIILRFKDFNSDKLCSNGKLPIYSGLHFAICDSLGIEVNDFRSHLKGKTLILDGYDESTNYASNQKVLKEFITIEERNRNIRLVVTSRENYIDLKEVKFDRCLRLEPFSEECIKGYYSKIMGKKLEPNISINNEKVLGIPVILYMALVVGIDISSNESRCELYERIFDIKSGIFERFKTERDVNSFAPTYESWENEAHPVVEYKYYFYNILQRLAFEIFENDRKPIEQTKYLDIVNEIIGDETKDLTEKIIFDFPIKNLYEKNSNITFVHDSIYEYFTAEYIYKEIKKGREDNDKENFAGVLGKLFKKNLLSKEIIEYLYYKMSIDISNGSNQFFVDAFDLMLEKGMTYYTNEQYENVIRCEGRVFANMLELLHAWEYDADNRLVFKFTHMLIEYINSSYSVGSGLNFERIDLSESNLFGSNLFGANLYGSNLYGANLNRANLTKADLRKADLRKADLRVANLVKANLNDANLESAKLNEANLTKVNLRRADLSKANLNRANLNSSDLNEAKLNGVDLRETKLIKADLSTSNLDKTTFSGVILDRNNITMLEKQLSEVLNDVNVYISKLDKIVSYQEYKELSQKGLC